MAADPQEIRRRIAEQIGLAEPENRAPRRVFFRGRYLEFPPDTSDEEIEQTLRAPASQFLHVSEARGVPAPLLADLVERLQDIPLADFVAGGLLEALRKRALGMRVSPTEAGTAALDVFPGFGGIVRGGKYFARSVQPTGIFFPNEAAYTAIPKEAEDLVKYGNVLDNPPSAIRMMYGDPASLLGSRMISNKINRSTVDFTFNIPNPEDAPIARVTFVSPSAGLPNIVDTAPGTFAAGLFRASRGVLPEGGVLKAARPDQLLLGYKYAMPTQPEGGVLAVANPLDRRELVRTAMDIVRTRTRIESAVFNLRAASEGLPVAMVNPGTSVNVGTSEALFLASAASAKVARDTAQKYPSLHGSVVEDFSRELYAAMKDVPIADASGIPISKWASLKDLLDKGAKLASVSANVRDEIMPILSSKSVGRALNDAAEAAGMSVHDYSKRIGRMVESYAKAFSDFDKLLKDVDPNYIRLMAPSYVREDFENFYTEMVRSMSPGGRRK